jgi:hypothetical protein
MVRYRENDAVLGRCENISILEHAALRIRPIFMDFRLDGDRDVENGLLCALKLLSFAIKRGPARNSEILLIGRASLSRRC